MCASNFGRWLPTGEYWLSQGRNGGSIFEEQWLSKWRQVALAERNIHQFLFEPMYKEFRIGCVIITKRFYVFYVSKNIFASCGYDVYSAEFSATLDILDFDTTNSPTIFSDKVLVYAGFINVNTFMNGDVF